MERGRNTTTTGKKAKTPAKASLIEDVVRKLLMDVSVERSSFNGFLC